MSERPYRDRYEKLFIQLCESVERWLVRGIAGALIMLLAVQLLLQFPWARGLLTRVDLLEGVPYRHGSETGNAAAQSLTSKGQGK